MKMNMQISKRAQACTALTRARTEERKKMIDRECTICSEETNFSYFLSCLWLFGSLLKTEHKGKP